MQKYAIIVAGGKGTRMGHEIPKQFVEVGVMPILARTIRRFAVAVPGIQLVVVLPKTQLDFWEELCQKHHLKIPHQLVVGGSSRFQSVSNGLKAVGDDGLVAIHDGVRPFVRPETIRQSFEVAGEKGNAIVSMPLKDSIREVMDGGQANEARDRQCFRIIQTPQTFQVKLIKEAFLLPEKSFFTDDASVAEHAGQPIHLIDGSYDNIKITTPEDLYLGEAIAAFQKAAGLDS